MNRMKQDELMAVSPIDGRYKEKTGELASFFSEGALIKYRTYIEIEYFIALCETGISPLNEISAERIAALRGIVSDFSQEDAQRIKK